MDPFTNGGGNAFHVAGAHVAHGELTGKTRLDAPPAVEPASRPRGYGATPDSDDAPQLSASALSFGKLTIVPSTVKRMNGLW